MLSSRLKENVPCFWWLFPRLKLYVYQLTGTLSLHVARSVCTANLTVNFRSAIQRSSQVFPFACFLHCLVFFLHHYLYSSLHPSLAISQLGYFHNIPTTQVSETDSFAPGVGSGGFFFFLKQYMSSSRGKVENHIGLSLSRFWVQLYYYLPYL